MSALRMETPARVIEALPELRALTAGYPLGASPEAMVLGGGGRGDLEASLKLEREAKRRSESADGRMLGVWARGAPGLGVEEQKCQLKAVVHAGLNGDRERGLRALRDLYRAQGEEELYACAALQAADAGDGAYLPLREAVNILVGSPLKGLAEQWIASIRPEGPSLLLARVKWWFRECRGVEATEAVSALKVRYPESPEALLGQSYAEYLSGHYREAEDGAVAVYQETKGSIEDTGLATEALELACMSHVRRTEPGPTHIRWMEKVLGRDPDSEVGWGLCVENYLSKGEPQWAVAEELLEKQASVVGAKFLVHAAKMRGEERRAERYGELAEEIRRRRQEAPKVPQGPVVSAAAPLPVERLSERIRSEYERAKREGSEPQRALMAACSEFETLCLMLRRESALFHLLGRSVQMVGDYAERVAVLRKVPSIQLEWQLAMSSLYSAVQVDSIESPFGNLWHQLREIKSCTEAIEPDGMVLSALCVAPRVKGLADTIRLSYVDCSRAYVDLEGRRGSPRELAELEARLLDLRAELDGVVRARLEGGEELVRGFVKRFAATPLFEATDTQSVLSA
jgi:hypothetical protein